METTATLRYGPNMAYGEKQTCHLDFCLKESIPGSDSENQISVFPDTLKDT